VIFQISTQWLFLEKADVEAGKLTFNLEKLKGLRVGLFGVLSTATTSRFSEAGASFDVLPPSFCQPGLGDMVFAALAPDG
jgi:hypothetical protein